MKIKNNIEKILIHGGLIITAESQTHRDILIENERIVAIGRNLTKRRSKQLEINATGLLIMPGGIDPHVHLTYPDRMSDGDVWVDDLTSGSNAALAGGITTLGNISFPIFGESPLDTIQREMDYVNKEAICDIFLHPVIFYPRYVTPYHLNKLVKSGYTSIKIFMSMAEFDLQSAAFINLIKAAGNEGMITMLHCEDHSIISDCTQRLIAEGHGSLKYYAESRPVISELVATERAIAICETTRSPVYIVHLSSKRALNECKNAQYRALPVYIETRPLYLHLTRERYLDPDGALYVGQPPLRSEEDVEALWEGLKNGTIHTLATDHAPWTREQKLDPSLNVNNLRPGVNNLQVMLPMLYSEGVVTERISVNRFVELTSTNSAKLFGLYPRKGSITEGADADLVLWDPKFTKSIQNKEMLSHAGFSIYHGWQVTGWPLITIRRGEIVYRDGRVVGQSGSGKIQARNKANF
jgi:dihydropyrimidinase